MRENRPYGSEGGVGESRSRPLSYPRAFVVASDWRRQSSPKHPSVVMGPRSGPGRRRRGTKEPLAIPAIHHILHKYQAGTASPWPLHCDVLIGGVPLPNAPERPTAPLKGLRRWRYSR